MYVGKACTSMYFSDALVTCVLARFVARITGLQEDNKNLKQSMSKVETERKQAQERNNILEKVSSEPALVYVLL